MHALYCVFFLIDLGENVCENGSVYSFNSHYDEIVEVESDSDDDSDNDTDDDENEMEFKYSGVLVNEILDQSSIEEISKELVRQALDTAYRAVSAELEENNTEN